MKPSFQPLQSQRIWQKMMASPKMRQALHLMQSPILEIAKIIDEEIVHNPLLEVEESDFSQENGELSTELKETNPESPLNFSENDYTFIDQLDQMSIGEQALSTDVETGRYDLEKWIPSQRSRYADLWLECKTIFREQREIKIAQDLIGNFSERGFLTTTIDHIAAENSCTTEQVEQVLQVIQNLDPPGIGARSLQEFLQIQLKKKQKEQTLAGKIVKNHFSSLLRNQIPLISKQLLIPIEQVAQTIRCDILTLTSHPEPDSLSFTSQQVVPDARIELRGDQLEIYIEEEWIPPVRVNRHYLHLLKKTTTPRETKDYLLQKLQNAKWLFRAIDRRRKTLRKLLSALCKKQCAFFFENEGNLTPLTMQTVASEIDVHVSTVARAAANKYVDTPKGVFPLRFFFTPSLQAARGSHVSTHSVKVLIAKCIRQENKLCPLSDAELSEQLKKWGVRCARRTVAKYRKELRIGNRWQRRKFSR